jgi:hypothetical protein
MAVTNLPRDEKVVTVSATGNMDAFTSGAHPMGVYGNRSPFQDSPRQWKTRNITWRERSGNYDGSVIAIPASS